MFSSKTHNIATTSISFADAGISPSMSSSSRLFPLLDSPLHPRVMTLRRQRQETSSSKATDRLTSLQKPLLHIVTILILILSIGATFLSQASTSSASSTTAITNQQQSIPPSSQPQPQQPWDQNTCKTQHGLPNPLASLFPQNATGVLNATLAIIPIPLSLARQLVKPSGCHSILESAYRSLIPGFPEGMYPVLMQAAHDHDVQLREYGIMLEDFSVGFPV